MSQRKRKRKIVNIGEYISANELRNYVNHAAFKDLSFLQGLIDDRQQTLLAQKYANEFPVYQRLHQQLEHTEKRIMELVAKAHHPEYSLVSEITPDFLFRYFRDYPTDDFFEQYTQWQDDIKQLHRLQDRIGAIAVIRESIRKAGFKIAKIHYSQRSLSTYLYIPMNQAEAFVVLYGEKHDASRLRQLLAQGQYHADQLFSVRLSDHISGQYYNQTTHSHENYAAADVNIYI